MKPSTLLSALAALAAGLLLTSCEKRSDAPKGEAKPENSMPPAAAPAQAKATVDADKLVEAFGSAGPEENSRAGKAAQAIRAESYVAAREILELLIKEGHLTPEQKELVTGFVGQLQEAK